MPSEDEIRKEMSDRLAAMKAMVDQAKAETAEIAAVVWSYFSALKDQGFDDNQALALSMQFQALIFTGGAGADETG